MSVYEFVGGKRRCCQQGLFKIDIKNGILVVVMYTHKFMDNPL